MILQIFEKMIDAVPFRMSVRTPLTGERIVRFLIKRPSAGSVRWVTIPSSNLVLLKIARAAFASEIARG
jgi:hypothetical protein